MDKRVRAAVARNPHADWQGARYNLLDIQQAFEQGRRADAPLYFIVGMFAAFMLCGIFSLATL